MTGMNSEWDVERRSLESNVASYLVYNVGTDAKRLPLHYSAGVDAELFSVSGAVRAVYDGNDNIGVGSPDEWFRAGECPRNQSGNDRGLRRVPYRMCASCRATARRCGPQ